MKEAEGLSLFDNKLDMLESIKKQERRNNRMKVKFKLRMVNVFILVATIIMVVSVDAVGQESILSQQFDLSTERSLEPQLFQMDVEIITRASNGSKAKVETYRMLLMGKPSIPSAETNWWTCSGFTIKIEENPEVTIPSMEGWSYEFDRKIGIDEYGQVLGIPHEKFESLIDNQGGKLDPVVGYQVCNQFVQFHAYVDLFASADPEGGKGIQDLKSIGDQVVFDDYSEDLPLAVGLMIKEGSIYRPGMETLEFKGLCFIDGQSCLLLGIDGGEGSYEMVIEVMPNVNEKTVGGTRYFGDMYVDLASMWLRKADITVIDVTETSIDGNVIANTTIESHYQIKMMTK